MQSKLDFEKEILRYLKDHVNDDIPPTVREIAAEVGIKSTSTVHKYLGILEEKGMITKRNGLNRTVKLVDRSTAHSRIPIIGTVAAGTPILAFEEILGYLSYSGKNCENLYGLKIKGESMIKAGILDGDIVVVRKTEAAEDGEIVVALIDEEATVKRFFRKNGGYLLQPENDDMEPIYTDHVQILGKVVSVLRIYESDGQVEML